MNTEMKQLIEDAAKLLGLEVVGWRGSALIVDNRGVLHGFNPADQNRGDLMMVAEAAEVGIDFANEVVLFAGDDPLHPPFPEHFTKCDYQSLALAVLRAASAVLKSRGE